ncbi:sporulation histidine kinase inhibitor Sda [Bacillus xiapuensis]|uniref:Sporulation histidine kinase inhibitor Sda n=1 Tax=Bacillus xiapuensis TaxID=2014075 RepID=A0ABU6NAL7_9BACI|nr:sporulation histidine kinase inhibitor Sda [Bacillus xiapuensis]
MMAELPKMNFVLGGLIVIAVENQLYKQRFKQLSNEQLIASYINAKNLKLDDHFLKMLLDEILLRDIYGLLFETSSKA